MSDKENVLLKNKHILLSIDEQLDPSYKKELHYIKSNFCGVVFSDMDSLDKHNHQLDTMSHSMLYFCGNVEKIQNELVKNMQFKLINVIKDLSYNYENNHDNYKLIDIGQVPINIHNVGVYFRNQFNPDKDHFTSINNEHQFQALTESTKATDAFRTGIYLTNVSSESKDVEEIKFRLLRCSSNLHGPTDNFRNSDTEIVNQVNDIAECFYETKTELNHVLAQIYQNKIVTTDTKSIERKAKIKEHSDKTKDMPRNGLIAFCTFYKNYSNGNFNDLGHVKKSKDDLYDYCYKNKSVLTRMRFRLKKMVTDPSLKKVFDITLYPNSVFLISLLTNRLYTHEIIPSGLQIDKIPTRLGYVVRCSNTEAVFKNNQTYINENGNYIKLEESDINEIKVLKDLYFKENVTDDMINYSKFYFSMNKGDYEKPII